MARSPPAQLFWHFLKSSCCQAMFRLLDAILQSLDLEFSGLDKGVDVEFTVAECLVRCLRTDLAGIPDLWSLVLLGVITAGIVLALFVRGRSIRHGLNVQSLLTQSKLRVARYSSLTSCMDPFRGVPVGYDNDLCSSCLLCCHGRHLHCSTPRGQVMARIK